MDSVVKLERRALGGFGFSVIGGVDTHLPPMVCAVVQNGSAHLSGRICAGDVILEVNGRPITELTTQEVVASIRDSPDELTLRLMKDKESKNCPSCGGVVLVSSSPGLHEDVAKQEPRSLTELKCRKCGKSLHITLSNSSLPEWQTSTRTSDSVPMKPSSTLPSIVTLGIQRKDVDQSDNSDDNRTTVDCSGVNELTMGNGSAGQSSKSLTGSLSDALLLTESQLQVEREQARELALKLYKLDGFTKDEVASELSKNTRFGKTVAQEYLKLFDFTDLSLTEALRKFFKYVVLIGETQERERIIIPFSERYYETNNPEYGSSDAVHTLICAILLLNTDLHGENTSKKMTLASFLENMTGLCDDGDFPKELLKSIYQEIKESPFEWSGERPPRSAPGTPKLSRNVNGIRASPGNPFLEIQCDENDKVYKEGLLHRKLTMKSEGKKTSAWKRKWMPFYATLKGLILFLYKSDEVSTLENTRNCLGIHHCFATRAMDYQKRQFVFHLVTADWREFLFQAKNHKDMIEWINTINLVAATFSAPPLPAPIGSSKRFQRPLLPFSKTRLSLAKQIEHHEKKAKESQDNLIACLQNQPGEGTSKDLQDWQEKKDFLEYDYKRYMSYVTALRGSKLARKLRVKPKGEASKPQSPVGPLPDDNYIQPARTVILNRGKKGFGFMMRGANCQTPHLNLKPTKEFPALQYIGKVEPNTEAGSKGVKTHDFILEVNDEDVATASHSHVVNLIKRSDKAVKLKIVTVPVSYVNGVDAVDSGYNSLAYSTLRANNRVPPPLPQRDPSTTLTLGKMRSAHSRPSRFEAGMGYSHEDPANFQVDKVITVSKESPWYTLHRQKPGVFNSRSAAQFKFNEVGETKSRNFTPQISSIQRSMQNIQSSQETVTGGKRPLTTKRSPVLGQSSLFPKSDIDSPTRRMLYPPFINELNPDRISSFSTEEDRTMMMFDDILREEAESENWSLSSWNSSDSSSPANIIAPLVFPGNDYDERKSSIGSSTRPWCEYSLGSPSKDSLNASTERIAQVRPSLSQELQNVEGTTTMNERRRRYCNGDESTISNSRRYEQVKTDANSDDTHFNPVVQALSQPNLNSKGTRFENLKDSNMESKQLSFGKDNASYVEALHFKQEKTKDSKIDNKGEENPLLRASDSVENGNDDGLVEQTFTTGMQIKLRLQPKKTSPTSQSEHLSPPETQPQSMNGNQASNEDHSHHSVLDAPSGFDEAAKGCTFNDKPLLEWSCGDVCDWLNSLNLPQYISTFKGNDIQGIHLPQLTKVELQELGMKSVGHRMTIENSVAKLCHPVKSNC